jgi:hypothetical protein
MSFEVKRVLFIRDFRSFTGGHLKVFHYFEHVRNSGFAQPKVLLTPASLRDRSNVFLKYPDLVLDTPERHDLLFLGGVDWPVADALGLLRSHTSIVNLLQGTMHGNPDDPSRPWLSHFATRICGSEEITQAIVATKLANGPVYTITHGLDALDHLRVHPSERTIDVVVAGLKDAELARKVGVGLEAAGVTFDVLTNHLSRNEYLDRIRQARVAVLLPLRQEGSFILSLEAMALDVAVVCPSVPGVHSFCHHEKTALLPERDADALVGAALWLLADRELSSRLRANGREMVGAFTLERERAAFLPILAQALGV